jgi:pSer/pThr/pTyr-binding forkhead associated (FHA) protein
VSDSFSDTPIISGRGGGAPREVPPASTMMIVSITRPSREPSNLDRGTISIGRDPAADIFIDSPDVSRLHAMIRATGERVELIDARSSNGTYLNGVRVERAVLHFGDVVRVGDEELRVAQRPMELQLAPGSGDSGVSASDSTTEEAMRLLAEERRQLALLYTIAVRFLEAGPSEDPIVLFFALLDRVAAFDAAFIVEGSRARARVHHHPAGLRLKVDDVLELVRIHEGGAARACDGPNEAIALSNFRARSRALIPIHDGGWFGLVAGVPNAYAEQLDFLAQLGRILSAAIASRATETTA